jgi:hypothetical protein
MLVEYPEVVAREHRQVHAVIHEAVSDDTILVAIAENMDHGHDVSNGGVEPTCESVAQSALNADLQRIVCTPSGASGSEEATHSDTRAQITTWLEAWAAALTQQASALAYINKTERQTTKCKSTSSVDVHDPVSGLCSVRWVHWDTVDVAANGMGPWHGRFLDVDGANRLVYSGPSSRQHAHSS